MVGRRSSVTGLRFSPKACAISKRYKSPLKAAEIRGNLSLRNRNRHFYRKQRVAESEFPAETESVPRKKPSTMLGGMISILNASQITW